MAITVTLDQFITDHSSDFVRVELAISSAVNDIIGGLARPIVQLDTEAPVAKIDTQTGEISLRFNGRLVMPPGLTSKQLGDMLSKAFEKLELGFVWAEEDGVMKFTALMPLISFDPSLAAVEEEIEPESDSGADDLDLPEDVDSGDDFEEPDTATEEPPKEVEAPEAPPPEEEA